jgi:2-haloacid dehalogenase
MNKTKVILFDLGNVLVEWNPSSLLDRIVPPLPMEESAQIKRYIRQWNQEWDRGLLNEGILTTIRKFPEYAHIIHAFKDGWRETLGEPMQGTVDILKSLKNRAYKIYAASNWAADTFEIARPTLYFLDLFDGIQISGIVGHVKPEKAFFQLLMKTYNFAADEALFIDDDNGNVAAAQSLGIQSLLFRSPGQLNQDLHKLNIY